MSTQPTSQPSILLTNGQPVVSCFSLSPEELRTRTQAAQVWAAEQVATLPKDLSEVDLLNQVADIKQHLLWHEDFPDGLRLLICDNLLFRLTADLSSQLPECNRGAELDFWDYAYVADTLRALLLEGCLERDGESMRRALAWVEQAGAALLRPLSGPTVAGPQTW